MRHWHRALHVRHFYLIIGDDGSGRHRAFAYRWNSEVCVSGRYVMVGRI